MLSDALELPSRQGASLFNKMDEDGDGVVDVTEVLIYGILWSGASWDEKMRAIFHINDFGQKGYLTKGEFDSAIHAVLFCLKWVAPRGAAIDPDWQLVGSNSEETRRFSHRGSGYQALPKAGHLLSAKLFPWPENKALPFKRYEEWVSSSPQPLSRLKLVVDQLIGANQPIKATVETEGLMRTMEYTCDEQQQAFQSLSAEWDELCVKLEGEECSTDTPVGSSLKKLNEIIAAQCKQLQILEDELEKNDPRRSLFTEDGHVQRVNRYVKGIKAIQKTFEVGISTHPHSTSLE
eukprot:GHVN01077707.1.p1 GENE.GHVN01077707.1~~GHVN01077707.1.p1  ORF type:complete len:292 (-),score=34.77 GHVN01077707.1:172-1047(-)